MSIIVFIMPSYGRGAEVLKGVAFMSHKAGMMKPKVAASFSHLASGASPYNSRLAHERDQ